MTMTKPLIPFAALLLLAAACGDDEPNRPNADAMVTIDLPTADAPTDGPKPKQDAPGPKADALAAADMPNGPWVKIVSPADKATVKNPVTFTVAANKVATVRIYADKWPLSAAWDPATKTTLSYTFNGLNFARTVELFGYDSAGKELAKIDSLAGILSPSLLASFAILGVFPIAVKKIMAWVKSRREEV